MPLGHFSNSECSLTVLISKVLANDNTFICLDTLFVSFNNSVVDSDRTSCLKGRDIATKLTLFNHFHQVWHFRLCLSLLVSQDDAARYVAELADFATLKFGRGVLKEALLGHAAL